VEQLVNRVSKSFDREGVVLVDQAAAAMLQLDPDPERSWSTFEGPPRIYLGQLDQLDGHALVADQHLDTVEAFALFHELLGVPWHRSGGVAGLGLMKALHPPGRTKPIDWESAGPDRAEAHEAQYFPRDWRNPQRFPLMHGYDKRRAGLAALTVAEVARYALQHTGRRTFDPRLAGWWLIEIPAWNEPRMPDPAGYGLDRDKGVRWVTTPTAVLLNQLADEGVSEGVRFVLDSWTGPKCRLFSSWTQTVEKAISGAERLMGIREHQGDPFGRWQDAERVREALSEVYRETNGMFSAMSSWVDRHDWYSTAVAVNRCNIWRTAWEIGKKQDRWPVLVDGDKWWYPSQLDDGPAAAPTWLDESTKPRGIVLGTKLGTWRYDGTRECPQK
jgi:hypothetical protein